MDVVPGFRDYAAGRRQATTVHSVTVVVGTVVPGVERAPNPVVACACGTWNPVVVRPVRAGEPTVREADPPAGAG